MKYSIADISTDLLLAAAFPAPHPEDPKCTCTVCAQTRTDAYDTLHDMQMGGTAALSSESLVAQVTALLGVDYLREWLRQREAARAAAGGAR